MILDLKNLKAGMLISGESVLVKDYSILTYKKNDELKPYVKGLVSSKGVDVEFVVWDYDLIEKFKSNNYLNVVVNIWGDSSMYQDKINLKLSRVEIAEGILPEMLMASYDVVALTEEFYTFINGLSPKIKTITDALFASDIGKRFFIEFAVSKMHDAAIGGVLNHTLKMLKITKILFDNDSRLENVVNKDLLYLGVISHDVGKVYEYYNGARTSTSFVTHNTSGVEMLHDIKDLIVDCYVLVFYNHLIAIVMGHHGQYGEPPQTVWAYIVHLVDMLESKTTGIVDAIEKNQGLKKQANGSTSMWINDRYMVVY